MMDEKLDETPEAGETPEQEVETPAEQPETFPRDYVEKLRKEAAEARTKAKTAEDLERENWTLKAQLDGRLADASDLAFTAGKDVAEAITELLAAKPHLAARRLESTEGLGNVGKPSTPPVSLMDMLR